MKQCTHNNPGNSGWWIKMKMNHILKTSLLRQFCLIHQKLLSYVSRWKHYKINWLTNKSNSFAVHNRIPAIILRICWGTWISQSQRVSPIQAEQSLHFVQQVPHLLDQSISSHIFCYLYTKVSSLSYIVALHNRINILTYSDQEIHIKKLFKSLAVYMFTLKQTNVRFLVPGDFPDKNRWDTRQFLRVYHIYSSSIEDLNLDGQTRSSIVKSAFSLHSFHMQIQTISREKDYSKYPIDARSILLCSLIYVL